MFVSELGSWDVGLVTPALDLSFGSWASGPASFLNKNYVCSWTWKLGHWTCHLSIGLVFWKLGLQPSFILEIMFVFGLGHSGVRLVTAALDLSFGSWACGPASFLNGNDVCSWTWKLEHWTCYISIGLVFWKLGLQPSFILNKILCLFLNLKAGTLDLSL